MTDDIDDVAEVRALIGMYIEGADGDVDLLRRAFHPGATMSGRIGDASDTFTPIENFFGLVASGREKAGPNYRAEIRSIDLTGDAGVAVLVETDYIGCDFVDYFMVAKIDGRWQITDKTYVHTGGSPTV